MPTAAPHTRRLHFTPGHCLLALLAVDFLLFLSQWFRWLPKGWPVLIAIAAVAVVMLVMFAWFGVALVFRRRFQFSMRSLMILVVAVALPFSWLAVEMKRAREQKTAVELLYASDCTVYYDNEADEQGNLPLFTVDLTKSPTVCLPTVMDEGPLARLLGRDFFHAAQAAAASKVPLPGNPNVMKFTQRDVAQAMLLALKDLPNLRALDLSEMPVDDSDLEHVVPLKELRQLDLTGTKVTDASVAKLQQALPNCKITR